MRLPVFAALLVLASTQVRADIIEISPDLYLLMRTMRGDMINAKLSTISEANDFAKSKGGVAVPVMWRVASTGLMSRVAEYQFRIMSREEALAAKPTLSDATITVNNIGACAPNPAVTALLPDLYGIESLNHLDLLARLPPEEEETETPPPPAIAEPPAAPPVSTQ